MKKLQSKSDNKKDFKKVLSLDKDGKGTVCTCGSKEFFFAPIVNVRCAKCIQPL